MTETPSTNLLLQNAQDSYYLCLCIGTEFTGYGPLLQQNYNNRKALSNVLEDENYTPNVNALQKMKSLYKSCMNVVAIQSRGWEPLVDLIRSTGVLSMLYLTQCHRKCVSAIVQGHPTEMLSQLVIPIQWQPHLVQHVHKVIDIFVVYVLHDPMS